MSARDQRGFSMAELLVVVAIIGIMALIAIPTWLAYGPAATITGAAREIQAGLYQARQLAITTRQNVCVQLVPPRGYRFMQGAVGPGCAGGVGAWTGADTDGGGTFRLANQNVVVVGANPIFTPFGTAQTTAVFTVTGPQARQITVTVLPSGRVTIP